MNDLGIYDYSGYYFGPIRRWLTPITTWSRRESPAWSTGGSVYDGYAQINDIIGTVAGFEPWPFFNPSAQLNRLGCPLRGAPAQGRLPGQTKEPNPAPQGCGQVGTRDCREDRRDRRDGGYQAGDVSVGIGSRMVPWKIRLTGSYP